MSWIRRAPVTAESLIICVAIFASCLFQAASSHQQFEEVQRDWGSIAHQEQPVEYDGIRREKVEELSGPFDVWDGEWWRIPIAPFHHATLMHLVLCVGATWFFGSRLERYWGSFTMGLFLVPALVIPIIAELSLGHAVQGLSGVICCMLGAIVVLRQFDGKLAEEFPDGVGEIGMGLILVSWMASLFGQMSFPDAAHISGFFYGAAFAWMNRRDVAHSRLLIASFVLAHFWILPGLFFAVHPVWVGRYNWYCAVTSTSYQRIWVGRYNWYNAVNLTSNQRIERSLERAITYDPSLTGAWLYWSKVAEDREQPILAWRRLIQGLRENPSSSALTDGSRRLWRHLNSTQRVQAEVALSEVFGGRSEIWLDQIRTSTPKAAAVMESESSDYSEVIDAQEFRLDQRQELPIIELSPSLLDRENPPPPKPPIDASEGATL